MEPLWADRLMSRAGRLRDPVYRATARAILRIRVMLFVWELTDEAVTARIELMTSSWGCIVAMRVSSRLSLALLVTSKPGRRVLTCRV